MTRLASALSAVLFLAACSAGGGGPRLIPLPLPLPVNHGLTTGEITVQPGASDEHGNLVVSCPAGGQACILNVADDGSASYDETGGIPTLMAASQNLELPAGHGLADDQITVQPGASDEHGNLVVSCPAGGQACVINLADDGSASYDKTGGIPTLMTASQTLELPAGHGLADDQITVQPGASDEHGNLVVSCPAGGQACVINLADDGSASYDKTGGIPTLMTASQTLELPAGHGLADDQITVQPGASDEHGNLVVSCPAGGQACVINLADDGSASYDKTGGIPTLMTASQTLELPAGHGLADDQITVQPGASDEHGNLVVSCPADGQACVINLADDGSASYPKTGGMPSVEILPLMAGTGQNMSDASPVFATDATSTLKATLADPANVIPALSTTVARDLGDEQGTELIEEFFVKSIRRNASGEYVVDYVLFDEDHQVTIPNNAVDCTSACRVTVNGRPFSFWNATTNDDDMASFEDGLGEYEYFASHRIHSQPEDTQGRLWFVFGVRNEELPMGTATYHGQLDTQTWKKADPDRDLRLDISGTMRIVANFDMRALEGRVYWIHGTEPGGDTRSTWPTSSFTLTNGRIVNGQFTATLTGVDSDPSTPLDESVRDFMGHVLAEFYGPNAEEVGGVVSATRNVDGTADDRVLYGFIGGRKTDRLTGVNDGEALSAGVDRDFEANSTALTAIERPTVEATADGYKITYMVDGQAQTIELGESDFGSNPASSGSATRYEKEKDGLDYLLWDSTEAFESKRSFVGRFRPEHFDVFALSPTRRDASDNALLVRRAYIVYGNRTTDMPTTGTASYAGRFRGYEWPTDQAVGSSDPSSVHYRGDLNLSADFGNSTVTGSATLLESRSGNRGAFSPASGGLSFNATINGNGLSATDLSGSGDLAGYSDGRVDGAFYGPGAAEVAGVFDATDGAKNKALYGFLGGQKQ